jgi:hypothetical protein
MNTSGKAIARAGDRWKTAIIGGEVAYNWGDYKIHPGESPTVTVSDPDHRDFLIYTLRWLHGTQLRWVADYDQSNQEARAGAEEVQKVFGYRYVIDEVQYPARIETGQPFEVSFSVINTGSAPFYYDWPVELALLDENRDVAWSAVFNDVDIREWLPGDKWNKKNNAWDIEPEIYHATGSFQIDSAMDAG